MTQQGILESIAESTPVEEIRQGCLDRSAEARAMVEVMPPSPERDRWIYVATLFDDLWRTSSDDFLRAWMLACLKMEMQT
jgi:hypothetical protein